MSGIASPWPAQRERLELRMRNINAARRLRIELAVDALERRGATPTRSAGRGKRRGLLTDRLGRRHPDWQVVGAVLDEDQLERARRGATRLGLANVRFVRADLTQDLGACA